MKKSITIFIVLNNLHADHPGCFRYDRATSPEMDSLAGPERFSPMPR